MPRKPTVPSIEFQIADFSKALANYSKNPNPKRDLFEQAIMDFNDQNQMAKIQWRRSHQSELLQDRNLLLHVTQYDYNLENPNFVAYGKRRGSLQLASEPEHGFWEPLKDFRLSKDAFFSHEDYWHSATGSQYSKSDMESFWRVIRIARASAQDCWEIYLQDDQ